jgi:hypothetical protein
MISKALAAVGVVLAASASAAASDHVQQRFFLSPSGNISCEMDLFSSTDRTAYCQTFSPPSSATIFLDGHVEECFGITYQCLGNPPDGVHKLAYGDSAVLGPFRCSSLTGGVRCVVTRSGHGFLISRSGISHF